MFFVGVQVVKNDETERNMTALEKEVKETKRSHPMLSEPREDMSFRPLRTVNLTNLRFKS
jgi:hypothetical protein